MLGTIPYVAYLCGGGAKPGKGGNWAEFAFLPSLAPGVAPEPMLTPTIGAVEDPGTPAAELVAPPPAPPPGVDGKKVDSGEGRSPEPAELRGAVDDGGPPKEEVALADTGVCG